MKNLNIGSTFMKTISHKRIFFILKIIFNEGHSLSHAKHYSSTDKIIFQVRNRNGQKVTERQNYHVNIFNIQ